MILQLHPFVNRDIVLDPDPIADADIVRHIDILAQGTILPDYRPTLHMAEMPDLRAGADLHIIIDIAAFVYERGRHVSFLKHSRSSYTPAMFRQYDFRKEIIP